MKIFILHASAGFGHQKVAEVMAEAFRSRGLNKDEVLLEDALDYTPWFFRTAYPAIYFHAVKSTPHLWGWFYENLDRPEVYRWVRPFREWGNSLVGGKLLRKVIESKPDVILCTHFFSAELLSRAKKRGKIKAHLVTAITDFYPHVFWIHEGTDAFWVMSKEGSQDLLNRGVPREKIHAGGIPADRRFHPTGRGRETLVQHGFTDDLFTVLLTSGSFGLAPAEAILNAMRPYGERIQCFVVCGNNASLARSLKEKKFGYPVRVFGFIDFMADLMEASDLMIAKPGGATSTESLMKGIPMVVLHPIPGQETRNAKLLKQRNVSFFMERPEQIQLILKTIMEHPHVMKEKRRNIQDLAKPHAADDLVSFVLNLRGSE